MPQQNQEIFYDTPHQKHIDKQVTVSSETEKELTKQGEEIVQSLNAQAKQSERFTRNATEALDRAKDQIVADEKLRRELEGKETPQERNAA